MGLFFETVGHYKSSFYETARNLLKSRDNQRVRAISLRDQLEAERKANEQLRAENQQLAQQIQSIQRHNQELRRKVEQLQTQPVVLPPDPPLPQHQFGARMISICIQLAKTVGIRASVKVLKLIFDWLSIKANIPNWTTVRTWLCRMGVDQLKHGGEKHDDWIWLADHSNQIGQEKVLTILGVRASKLPAPGQTLRHQDVHVLAVVPGKQWRREDVAVQYEVVQKITGTPKMIVTDGAVELRESVQILKKDGENPLLLRDMKHFAANELERMIGHSEAFRKRPG